jgi:hypothetical protein
MTTDELIEEYKGLPQNCYEINYADKKAVKKNNNSVKRMYKIIDILIKDGGNEWVSEFKKLLDSEDYRTNLWAATHLLEKLKLEEETETKALEIIKKAATGDDVLAQGYKYWLRDWESKRGA